MLRIPIYIVTGFLDAGKTSLINEILKQKKMQERSLLLVQFESGEEEAQAYKNVKQVLSFNKKDLEESKGKITQELAQTLQNHSVDALWIEYNGVAMFSDLFQILGEISVAGREYYIDKVIHLIDYPVFQTIFGKTGAPMLEQIANSDIAVVRGISSPEDRKSLKTTLRSLSTDIEIILENEKDTLFNKINQRKMPVAKEIGIVGLTLILAFLFLSKGLDIRNSSLNTILNVFLGILFQAVPFLLIGVLISSFIQIFISRETIERIFPKKLGAGIVTAVFAGFFLPVCDCASIPIFRSLVKKGVPLPAAVTFMTATPVINPVVMLSTYYAFNGSLRIVFTRVLLGIIAAIFIGLLFSVIPSNVTERLSSNMDAVLCSCGCYDGTENVDTLRGKTTLFIRHSQIEFFNVGKYLMIGAFVTAILQTTLSKSFAAVGSGDFALSIVIMMLMAFLLSLCSSSDAVIARSLANRFPLASTMGFLVFGPMMDVKNIILLSGYFSKRFIVKLIAITSIVCFVVVFFLSKIFLGV